MIQQQQKGVIKTLRFQLHQKQNILGLCHYCKTPGHLRKDCYKLSAPGTFSPLADLVPKEPQGLVPSPLLKQLGEAPLQVRNESSPVLVGTGPTLSVPTPLPLNSPCLGAK